LARSSPQNPANQPGLATASKYQHTANPNPSHVGLYIHTLAEFLHLPGFNVAHFDVEGVDGRVVFIIEDNLNQSVPNVPLTGIQQVAGDFPVTRSAFCVSKILYRHAGGAFRIPLRLPGRTGTEKKDQDDYKSYSSMNQNYVSLVAA
jgi:hypothetical protein